MFDCYIMAQRHMFVMYNYSLLVLVNIAKILVEVFVIPFTHVID